MFLQCSCLLLAPYFGESNFKDTSSLPQEHIM
jgi:hypothetical protein